MVIQRWDPLRDLMELQDRMKQLFADALSRSAGTVGAGEGGGNGWVPPIDLFEEEERYVLRADLPGVSPEAVEIQIENGLLTLGGERKVDSTVSPDSFLRIERPYGRFAAQLSLPPSVETRSIRAAHRNGVIEIVLPKRKDAPPSRIEVAAD
ncbi:MAG TPA: Hsp20/alpha crystallin family protein [Candidatus Polarisedimenticolaceae bacterium]|nr:Hsp20/alpha crystallin family protein [Candidatus Polarisedimenticolaceae bacterium]